MIDLENYKKEIDKIIDDALSEDIGTEDITTNAIFREEKKVRASVFSREDGILAGLPIISRLFEKIDPGLTLTIKFRDGERVAKKTEIMYIEGDIRSLLTGERTALNFLGRLSGIATLTGKFCREAGKSKAKILDTRKTTPGLRILEKYAVFCGGGINHRLGLYDMILIKDNHIEGAGSIEEAVRLTREYCVDKKTNVTLEVEVKNLKELEQALEVDAEWIMLDNMGIEDMKKAVALVNGRAKLEASGNVTLNNVEKIASTGVDYISTGFITHSAPVMDFSLLIT